jgi:LPXTG-motif cell wall-anchored protein
MVVVFTAALGAAGALGGTAAASSYPPDGSTPTTVLSGGDTAQAAPQTPTGELPQTGSDSEMAVRLAAGAVAAGAGLVIVARRRRRPADA